MWHRLEDMTKEQLMEFICFLEDKELVASDLAIDQFLRVGIYAEDDDD